MNARILAQLAALAREIYLALMGFDASEIIVRKLHQTKRSVVAAGRRARVESILFLRKKPAAMSVTLLPPPYKLWPYERDLRAGEIISILKEKGKLSGNLEKPLTVTVSPHDFDECRRLVFSHSIKTHTGLVEPTWQAILENGASGTPAARKDPKYATHGLHPYKGKFYPQLAKGLLNLINPSPGALVFDPFCGSGTTLLESYLNGFRGCGVDMNPLAILIAKAKAGILEVAPDDLKEASSALIDLIDYPKKETESRYSEFPQECVEEIDRWFASRISLKINWLLRQIRKVSGGTIRAFFETVLSSIIREVSNQDPSDLRIRYRKEPLEDADVYALFKRALLIQLEKVEKFWGIRGYSPQLFHPVNVCLGDSRSLESLKQLGLTESSVDLVLTSPPYATALPYIDTDRLSLLTILGLSSSVRRPIEYGLIGSREINTSDRVQFENEVMSRSELPVEILNFVSGLSRMLEKEDAGFRKLNMPSLLLRFFLDMERVLRNAHHVSKKGGPAMVVIGDNTIEIADKKMVIPSTDFLGLIAEKIGFREEQRIDISVTTENLIHMRNAITKNVVLCLRK